MIVRPVGADAVRPLRRSVLRPHQSPDELVYPGDDAPETLHAAVIDEDGAMVGIATLSREDHPSDPRPGDWRLRGMATVPEVRGTGVGARLLAACLEHARAHDGARVWCNARSPAIGFYERAGFVAEGGEFAIERLGPHVRMTRTL
jgi:GNAT superfamily N-acetyltransferase